MCVYSDVNTRMNALMLVIPLCAVSVCVSRMPGGPEVDRRGKERKDRERERGERLCKAGRTTGTQPRPSVPAQINRVRAARHCGWRLGILAHLNTHGHKHGPHLLSQKTKPMLSWENNNNNKTGACVYVCVLTWDAHVQIISRSELIFAAQWAEFYRAQFKWGSWR